MGLLKRQDHLDALEDVLDQERQAILAGRFDVLARLMAEKVRLLDHAHRSAQPDRLIRVRDKATRNQALLQAASQGVRSVSNRLARQETRANSLHTYDHKGRRLGVRTATSGLEKRA